MSQTIRIVSGVNEGISFEIEEGQELKLGRSANNDVVLPYDSCISGKHALIALQDGETKICDLASTNGTFLDGRRIKHGIHYKISEFVVLGATILHLSDNPEPCDFQPIPATSDDAEKWQSLKLFRTVLSNNQKEPFIHSAHLFLGLLMLHPRELGPFLSGLGMHLDPNDLKTRLHHCELFDGNYGWLNRSLTLRARLPKDSGLMLTPKAQALLDSALDGEFDPMNMLNEMLTNDFNLIFPLLDWKRLHDRWCETLQKRTQPAPEQERSMEEHSLSERSYGFRQLKSFWERLEQTHALGELLVLTGSRGCGKTTALHQGFEKEKALMTPAFYQGPRTFLDPKAFLFFNPPSKLSGYAWRAGEMLQRGDFLIIDHFDDMWLAMQQENIDRTGLLKALRGHRGPVIIGVSRENMELIDTHLGAVNILDMDIHLKPHLLNYYEAFLNGFERRVKGILSPKARRFFIEKVASETPYNLGALKEFLTLCAGRTQAIDPAFSEQGEETRRMGLLGEGCFRDVYNTWVHRNTGSSPEEDKEEAFLIQLENLLHEFARGVLNVHLRYSDQSRSFRDPGRLSRRRKIEELKGHLVYMFSAFGSGFGTWFQEFWMKVDPDVIRAESEHANNPKKLWMEFCERTRTITSDYAEDLFNETMSRVFLEARRTRKTPDKK